MKCKYKPEHKSLSLTVNMELSVRSCNLNVTKNQRWNVYMCGHGKAILLFSLTSVVVCILFSWWHCKRKVHFEPLCTSLCFYFSLWRTTQIPNLDGSKGTKGLLSRRLPSQIALVLSETKKNDEFTAKPWDGLQWLWRCCPCLHCRRGQENDRVKVYLSDLCQCRKLKMHIRCMLLRAVQICCCSHLQF